MSPSARTVGIHRVVGRRSPRRRSARARVTFAVLAVPALVGAVLVLADLADPPRLISSESDVSIARMEGLAAASLQHALDLVGTGGDGDGLALTASRRHLDALHALGEQRGGAGDPAVEVATRAGGALAALEAGRIEEGRMLFDLAFGHSVPTTASTTGSEARVWGEVLAGGVLAGAVAAGAAWAWAYRRSRGVVSPVDSESDDARPQTDLLDVARRVAGDVRGAHRSEARAAEGEGREGGGSVLVEGSPATVVVDRARLEPALRALVVAACRRRSRHVAIVVGETARGARVVLAHDGRSGMGFGDRHRSIAVRRARATLMALGATVHVGTKDGLTRCVVDLPGEAVVAA